MPVALQVVPDALAVGALVLAGLAGAEDLVRKVAAVVETIAVLVLVDTESVGTFELVDGTRASEFVTKKYNCGYGNLQKDHW